MSNQNIKLKMNVHNLLSNSCHKAATVALVYELN